MTPGLICHFELHIRGLPEIYGKVSNYAKLELIKHGGGKRVESTGGSARATFTERADDPQL